MERKEDGLLRLGPDGCFEPCKHEFIGDLCKFCLGWSIPEAKERAFEAMIECDRLTAKYSRMEAVAMVHAKFSRPLPEETKSSKGNHWCSGYRDVPNEEGS